MKQEKPLQWEAFTPQLVNSPHLLQLEKDWAQQWRPSIAKKNFFLKKETSKKKLGMEQLFPKLVKVFNLQTT